MASSEAVVALIGEAMEIVVDDRVSSIEYSGTGTRTREAAKLEAKQTQALANLIGEVGLVNAVKWIRDACEIASEVDDPGIEASVKARAAAAAVGFGAVLAALRGTK